VTPEQFYELLNITSEALSPECYIADVVLGDNNLETEFIENAIEYASENKQEFLRNHTEATPERIELVIRFLCWLKDVPEETREALLDWFDR
jgi:hypothetical protein